MAGTIIISLDCEGRFGVADHLTPALAAQLTDERLAAAYAHIIATLDALSLPATFAVVSLFARPDSAEKTALVRDLAQDLPYLAAARDQLAAGEEGWDGARFLDGLHDRHELAFHGGSHVPWDMLTEEQARDACKALLASRSSCFVFQVKNASDL